MFFETIREWLSEHFNVPWLNLPGIGLTEIVDILLVAVILYLILHWIRQTRAWALFKGIMIVLVVAALANLFNLVTVLWIVQNAFAMGLVVVVILFQPELRKALEQIGKGRYLRPLSKGGAAQNALWSPYTANEIVKAAYAMGKVRTGALMVLEQGVNLDEYAGTGIPLDAVVSIQLLINIFEKNTPLHDGALIIRHDRIVSAACILPLTEREISHDLGTRHRAAIGMSEASDALVLVVSEETGAVSMAVGGQLARDLSEYELRDRLIKGDDEDRPRSFGFFRGKRE